MEETDQCLPVAPLRDVLEQFREAMAPITSQEEFQKIEQDIESFFTGEGNFLQEKLKECSKQLRGTSWLREYSQQRFLSLRTPLTIVGNFTLEFWKNGEETSLLRNGTALAWSVGRLYQQLQAGEVPVPQGSSLSVRSEQMERVLGSARLPGHGTDTYAVYPADEVRAFGVFYRNRYYWVDSRFLFLQKPEVRTAFLRRYWYAESLEEVAAYMGWGLSRTKSVLFRTRKRLETYLKQEGY